MKFTSPFFLLASASIIWGATAPIMKLTLQEVPIFSLAAVRMSVASLILGSIIYKSLKIKKEDSLRFVAAAITGATLNLTLFFAGLRLTYAINASFLVATVPIFTIVAAHFYLREKFSPRLILAAGIALIGTIIIMGKPENATTFSQFLGNILLLLATLSWVIHEIICKKLLKIYASSQVAFYTMAIGALTFLPLALWEYWANPTWIQNVSFTSLSGLLYGIFFASLAAYWAWQKGLALLPAGQAAFFFYLDPVSGVILSMILLGERLTPTLIVGGILIIIGVYLAEQKRKSHLLHR